MTALLASARPAAGRAPTIRRIGALARPGLLAVAVRLVREELTAACGPTLTRPVAVACYPPATAREHVYAAATTEEQRAATYALLDQNPTWFFVVGTAHQLWPQLRPHLS